ncbi:hypothetical protein M422DRAFT_786140 [Sphaerobolus stellatus SS14]|uniref:DUF6534 domain-containing protein n=1 Tax=Sphaerobolus stellatus (strain SS14) TaxID=990650 RepID=A0A0C9U394_SPHS4|nr:hypothetical protein M422DRAFT_786140 [Sphaerobolus stellatus SS14]
MALDKLVLYSLNVGLVTTAIAVLFLITWLVVSHELILWTAFYYPAGEIYVNSILVSLHTRDSLREQMNNRQASRFETLELATFTGR